jgi:hypothetical protein
MCVCVCVRTPLWYHHPILKYKYIFFFALNSQTGIGWGDAVTDLSNTDLPLQSTTMSGWAAFVTWRGTYITKQLSWTNSVSLKNKIVVLVVDGWLCLISLSLLLFCQYSPG